MMNRSGMIEAPDSILRARLPRLETREACLVAAGRNDVNLVAPGTHFPCVRVPGPIPPTLSFWSIKTDSLKEARLLALWWNSTFHLAQLMENQTEVGGSWLGRLGDTLHRLPCSEPENALARTQAGIAGDVRSMEVRPVSASA